MRLTPLTVLALAACVTTNAAVLNPDVKYARTCADAVRLFTSAERVPGQYQEIALLSSKGESGLTNEEQMFKSQRKKAAAIGANGIIVGDVKEPNAGTKIIGSLLGTGAERKGSAVAIYIPSDSSRVRRVCGKGTQPEEPQQAAPAPAATMSSPAPAATTESPRPLPPGTQYVGDADTRRYYVAECPAAARVRNAYYFRTAGAAEAAGYQGAACP